jgi:hypothetical protein
VDVSKSIVSASRTAGSAAGPAGAVTARIRRKWREVGRIDGLMIGHGLPNLHRIYQINDYKHYEKGQTLLSIVVGFTPLKDLPQVVHKAINDF